MLHHIKMAVCHVREYHNIYHIANDFYWQGRHGTGRHSIVKVCTDIPFVREYLWRKLVTNVVVLNYRVNERDDAHIGIRWAFLEVTAIMISAR